MLRRHTRRGIIRDVRRSFLGHPYVKAEKYRLPVEVLLGRTAKSIECKLQNVSGALQAIEYPWLKGYAPATNFKMSVVDAVTLWFKLHTDWTERRHVMKGSEQKDPDALFMGPPPTLANRQPPRDLAKMLRVAQKFDVAGWDAQNRALGRAGEELVVSPERSVLHVHERADLAKKVCWASEEKGDGLGYDIESFAPDGRPRLIEVKTTNGWKCTPFHITKNEIEVAEERKTEWCLFKLYEFSTEPKGFELYPPPKAHVALTALKYRAGFH